MKQYIDKADVMAEIEKLQLCTMDEDGNFYSPEAQGEYNALCKLESFINTLEVKEEVISSDPIKAMKEALRMEYEKGRADVLRCIDPDEMVADFCSQPLSKTRSLASIYRQGIIDIIKRINRNEETSITSTHSIDDGGVQLPKP